MLKDGWAVNGVSRSSFGSLKISPSKKGFVQIEIVLDDNEHDNIVAELLNGEEILKPIVESVNWRAKQPTVPLKVVSWYVSVNCAMMSH